MTRRRRECLKCSKRFTTYERVGNIDLKVVKKSGDKEDFDPEKVKRGIAKACWKRLVTEEQIQGVVDDIEMKLLNRKSTEVPSKDIGKMVMSRLQKLDSVAYLRFASVYLDFQNVKEFKDFVKQVNDVEKK